MYMNHEKREKTNFEDIYKKTERMEMFCITVKGITTPENSGVANGMNHEKTAEHHAADGHGIFFTNG